MRQVDSEYLKSRIDADQSIKIIDVRSSMEFERGKIETSINIPLDIFEAEMSSKLPDKEEEIYLYCLSGSRSEIAANILERAGYKNVNNLISGLLSWRVRYSLTG